MKAVDQCDAPMVSIPGGEPLLHPQIREIVEGLIERKKYVYLCSNAILLKDKLEAGWFKPSKYLSFSIHLDGLEEHHDFAVCRDGTYQKALAGIRTAVEMDSGSPPTPPSSRGRSERLPGLLRRTDGGRGRG